MAVTPNAVVPAVVELDGWALEPLVADDAPLVAQLLQQRGHQYMLEMAPDEMFIRSAIAELAAQPLALPLMILRDQYCGGVATTALANVRTLSASLIALFVDPPGATLPLAMYVRQLFWTFPLRRLYAQVPAMDLTREYVDLLGSVGFVDEGRLVSHAEIGGQAFDVVTLGLLRQDFEDWCAVHQPRLALEAPR